MRRALAALASAALALAVFTSARPTQDAHAATSCTKHTERVVKHVKRHGKRKRVVHFTHYWTCQEVAEPSAPTAAAPPAPAPVPTPTPVPQPEPEANAVSIATNDHTDPYGYVPSRTTVKAGRLTVQLDNRAGEDEHNMDMQRLGGGGELEGPVIAALSAAREGHSEPTTVEVQLGTYRMWCTIGQHAEHGMTATVTVVE